MLRSARIACLALAALPAFAFAQADDSVIPAATCVKPVVPALGAKLDKKTADTLNGAVNAYAACSSAYIAERRAIAARHQAIVTAQTDAGNTYARDFNAYASALEAFSKSQAAATKK